MNIKITTVFLQTDLNLLFLYYLGYKCPDPTKPPEACAPGYYADSTGLTYCVPVGLSFHTFFIYINIQFNFSFVSVRAQLFLDVK